MRLFFDLSQESKWHRQEWEHCLEEVSTGQGPDQIARSRAEADVIIVTGTPQLTEPVAKIFRRIPRGEFVWDFCDQPAGRHPGFYCSLPRPLHDPVRHRSFCYPITFNEQIRAYDARDASLLFSFVGAISSPLRDRLLRCLAQHPIRSRGIIKVQGGPWSAMFDRSGLPIKRDYAESLRRARFILCPRGNGVGSVRLFEVMKAGRVPVIVSDDYVLPVGVDWNSCSVRIREHEVGKIPGMLRDREEEWEPMAAAARREWERCFGPARLLAEMSRHLQAIRSADRGPALRHTAALVAAVARHRVKALRRGGQALLQRWRKPATG